MGVIAYCHILFARRKLQIPKGRGLYNVVETTWGVSDTYSLTKIAEFLCLFCIKLMLNILTILWIIVDVFL